MSRKNFLHYPILVAGDMSTATLTSAVTNIQRADSIGVQFAFSGSPVGTFAVQVSSDYAQDANGNVTNSGTWASLSLSPSPATTLGSPIYVDISQTSAPWIRATYTKASGTGSLNITLVSKMK